MESILMKGFQRRILEISLILFLILMNGCVTQAPRTTASNNQSSHIYSDSFDKAWRVVFAALQDEGINMNVVDKSSGIINGVKNLLPSTLDMLTHYSVRILVNTSVQRVGGNKIKVSIRTREERKYEERGWRPSSGDTSEYSEALYNKIGKELNIAGEIRSVRTVSSTKRVKEVRSAQNRLQELGYRPGVADGIMGRNTSRAIRAFQVESDLKVTGVLDEKTKAALMNATPKTSSVATHLSKSPSPEESRKEPITPYVETNPAETLASQGAKQASFEPPPPRESTGKLRIVEETELKAAADPYSETKATLRVGQSVEMLKKAGQWYEVRAEGKEGFVYAEFVQ